MPDLYSVGLPYSWDGTVGSKWALTSGGVGGLPIPTTADNVFVDNNSGAATLTVATGNTGCKDLKFISGSGSFASTWAGSAAMSIAGSLLLSAGMTRSYTGAITMSSTSAGNTINTNGLALGSNVTFNGVGGSWQFLSAASLGATHNYTLTNGTIDLNGFTLTSQTFSSNNSNTRAIAFNGGNITLTDNSSSIIACSTLTGLTVSGTPTFNLTYSGASGTRTITWGSAAGGTVARAISVNITAGTDTIAVTSGSQLGSLTFPNLGITYSGSNALLLAGSLTAGASMNWTNTGDITFNGGSGSFTATQVITSAGKTFANNMTIDGVGTTVQLADTHLNDASKTLTVTNGALDLNSKTLTIGVLSSSNANTRTLGWGASGTLNLNGSGVTVYDTGTTTNLTVSGTPVVNLTYALGVGTRTITPGSLAEAQTVTFNVTNGGSDIFTNSAGSIKALNFTGYTGTFSGSNALTLYGSLTAVSGMTWSSTGAFTFGATSGTQVITTAGKTFNNAITVNGVGGTVQLGDNHVNNTLNPITLTNGTFDLNGKTLSTFTFSSSNANVRVLAFGTGNMVLAGNGGTVWDTSTVTNLSVTGTPVVSLNYSGSAGTRTVNTGALSEANSVSFNVTAGTDIFTGTAGNVFRSLDFTGFAGTWSNVTRTLYGSLTLSTGMTVTAGANATTFGATSGIKSIASLGKTMDFPIVINGPGGTFQLSDALNMAARPLTLTNGIFDANGKAVTFGSLVLGSGTKTLTLGSATTTVSGAGTAWDAATNGAGLTVSASVGTISMTSASTKTFAGNGKTWPTLNQGGAGELIVTGANTFAAISGSTGTLTLPAGSTTTVSAFTYGSGTLQSSTPGSPATISKASGVVNVTGLTIIDSTATGGATFNAPTSAGNVDGGGNTGWNFTPAPSGGVAQPGSLSIALGGLKI